MIIDAPGYSPSVCNKPEILIGTQIRLGNVTSGIAPTIVIAKNSLTPKTVVKTKDNLHEPLQGEHDAAPKISGVNIMALILGKFAQKCFFKFLTRIMNIQESFWAFSLLHWSF